MTQQRQPRRAKDRLIKLLRRAISSGQLPRGQRLTEVSLGKALGISRTPVREALQTLHLFGLLTRHESGRGFEVKGYTLEEARDIYFVRTVLEEAGAERAARRVTEEDIALLFDILERERHDLEQGVPRTVRTTLYDLHSQIIRLSGSAQLQRSYANLLDNVAMIVTTREPEPDATWNSHKEHAAIVDALSRRDPEAAKRRVREHLQTSLQYLLADPSRLEPREEPLQVVLERLSAEFDKAKESAAGNGGKDPEKDG